MGIHCLVTATSVDCTSYQEQLVLQGWDKTYCLQFVEADGFSDIHFFGDKTFEVCACPAVCSTAACMNGPRQ